MFESTVEFGAKCFPNLVGTGLLMQTTYNACCRGNIVFNTVNTGILMLCYSEGRLPPVSDPIKEWKSKRSVFSHPVEPVVAKKGGGKDCLTEPVEPVVATGEEVRKPSKGGASEGKS